VNQNYPRLAGQHAEYLSLQLSLFQAKRRGGTEYHTLMHKFVGQLSDEHIRAVTRYYASLEPDHRRNTEENTEGNTGR
jgi:cytochrome c553